LRPGRADHQRSARQQHAHDLLHPCVRRERGELCAGEAGPQCRFWRRRERRRRALRLCDRRHRARSAGRRSRPGLRGRGRLPRCRRAALGALRSRQCARGGGAPSEEARRSRACLGTERRVCGVTACLQARVCVSAGLLYLSAEHALRWPVPEPRRCAHRRPATSTWRAWRRARAAARPRWSCKRRSQARRAAPAAGAAAAASAAATLAATRQRPARAPMLPRRAPAARCWAAQSGCCKNLELCRFRRTSACCLPGWCPCRVHGMRLESPVIGTVCTLLSVVGALR